VCERENVCEINCYQWFIWKQMTSLLAITKWHRGLLVCHSWQNINWP
jgi:hypothetical protein